MPVDPVTLAKIDQAITQIVDRIVQITATKEPTILDQGRRVEMNEYLKVLNETLKDLRGQRAEVTGGRLGILWLGKPYPDSGGE